MPAPQHRFSFQSRVVVLAGLLALTLSGCSGVEAVEVPSARPSAPASQTSTPEGQPTPDPSASEVEPDEEAPAELVLLPDASAADNLAYFEQTIQSVWGSGESGVSRAYFAALEAAGFDASVIERTSDTTAIGNTADTFSVAVPWHDGQCLIGQVGPSTGEAVAAIAPRLGNGACLIGAVIRGE